MPAARHRLDAVPHEHTAVRDIDPQRAARAVAQQAARPLLRRQAFDQRLHGQRFGGGLKLLGRTAPPGRRFGNMQSRVLKPNLLGAMHVGDEHLAVVGERAQKCRLLAVAGVNPDPVEAPPGRARCAHMSSAYWLFEVSCRAAAGTPA